MKIREIVLEGGNVQLGDLTAQRIDLKSINRDQIVAILSDTLRAISATYQKQYQQPLWAHDITEYLSGSALSLFNLQQIPTSTFVQKKPTVGDIDTMVNKDAASTLQEFLTKAQGQTMGSAKLLGFKPTAGQYITLWEFTNPPIRVQIDMEMVDFTDQGSPTDWAKYSHSSTWEDMSHGIKGVMHKYLLRALTTRGLKDIVILKGKKELPSKVTSTELAFSVQRGLRKKIVPVMDNGVQREMDGLKVYKEIPTKDSTYITNLPVLFQTMFGVVPQSQELQKFWSYVGTLELAKKYFSKEQLSLVELGFARTLWGPEGQGLYRNDPKQDKHDKTIAFNYMVQVLGVPYDRVAIDKMQAQYYNSYK